MSTLTKTGIVEEVILRTGLSHKDAMNAVETFIEIIKGRLEQGEAVSISGFGKWKVRDKAARKGRNPQTGQEITIPPRRVVTFSLSNVLRARLSK
ncbi:MAG: integration host factor subunit alpha [Deltaproteobacteria bacterium]|nr:integration host factor subunit alpha [Deltaproteobacteria bacterium]